MSPTPQAPPTDRPLTAGDNEGWIPNPGFNPVGEARVDTKHANGAINLGWTAAQWSVFWGIDRQQDPQDITHYRLARPATSTASEEEDYTSPSGYEAKLIDGQWRIGMAGNLDCIHDAEITVHKHISDEWSETLAKRIAAALASPPVSERERELEGALRVEREWHDLRADLAFDEARECSARGEKSAEMDAMRAYTLHSTHLNAIDKALTAQPSGEPTHG